jgi:hypothetical protein
MQQIFSFGKAVKRLSWGLNGSGRKYMPGRGKLLVWKIDGEGSQFISDDIC